MISNSPREATPLVTHDLSVARDRVEFFIKIVQLARVLASLSCQVGTRAVPEFQVIVRYVAHL